MAKRGPKPKRLEVAPLYQDWEPPAHLTARARAEFERVAGLLRQRGLLGSADAELVARRAELVDVAEGAMRQIAEDGAYVTSDRGNLSPHPALKVHRDSASLIRLIDQTLGLVPPRSRAASKAEAQLGYSAWRAKLAGGTA